MMPPEKYRFICKFASKKSTSATGKTSWLATCTCPQSACRHPAVALVLGSGAQDRNYGGTGLALGNYFARLGFACLAWDKPGVGESTGDFNAQMLRDRARKRWGPSISFEHGMIFVPTASAFGPQLRRHGRAADRCGSFRQSSLPHRGLRLARAGLATGPNRGGSGNSPRTVGRTKKSWQRRSPNFEWT